MLRLPPNKALKLTAHGCVRESALERRSLTPCWTDAEHRMKTRDVATIAFRVLALWITISALTALVDLLFNWKTVAAQVMGSFSCVRYAPTETELFWTSASAFVGRAVIGVVAWRLSPRLARITPLSES